MFSKLLVICIGNICRSPMAACLLAERTVGRGVTVESAGLAALVDEPMDPFALQVLQQHGHQPAEHRARQLQRLHLQEADLVLVLERNMVERVLRVAPESRGKVFCLGKWQSNRDIPDPYRQSHAVFEHTYVLIREAVDAWVKHLA